MFFHTNPQAELDLFHQRADELAREAAAYRRARVAADGRHRRRFGRRARGERPGETTITR
jgi:hypothetical protein